MEVLGSSLGNSHRQKRKAVWWGPSPNHAHGGSFSAPGCLSFLYIFLGFLGVGSTRGVTKRSLAMIP